MNASFDCIILDASCLRGFRHLIKTKLPGSINQIGGSQDENAAILGKSSSITLQESHRAVGLADGQIDPAGQLETNPFRLRVLCKSPAILVK
jgi:hypothetical protein